MVLQTVTRFTHQLQGQLRYKNLPLLRRSPVSFCFQAVLAPFIFLGILAILQYEDITFQQASRDAEVNITVGQNLPGLSVCDNPANSCITLLYCEPNYSSLPVELLPLWIAWYNSSVYDGIIHEFIELNNRRLSTNRDAFLTLEAPISDLTFIPHRPMGLAKVPSASFIYDYILRHPNTTVYGISFDASDINVRNVEYTVWHNSSLGMDSTTGGLFSDDGVLKLMRGLDEAIISYLYSDASEKPWINVTVHEWPHVFVGPISDSVVQSAGPTFSFCSMAMIFLSSLSHLAAEKESLHRAMLDTVGLEPMSYFIAHLVSTAILVLINSAVSTLLGQFVFKFEMFVRTSSTVLVLSFFMFGLAMVALSVFASCFVSSRSGAGILGILILVVGVLSQTFLFSGQELGYIWWSGAAADSSLWKILSCLPFFNFGKLFLDISVYTTGKLNPVTNTFAQGPGFSFSSLTTSVPLELRPIYANDTIPQVPPPSQSLLLLMANIVGYICAAWYFDKTAPSESGASAHSALWFIFTKRYWFPNVVQYAQSSSESDILSESDAFNPIYSLRIENISKIFIANTWLRSARKIQAVGNVTLTLRSGEIFVLLGKSGAGKSTLTKILCGAMAASSGTFQMESKNLQDKNKKLCDFVGMCPQQDVLFSLLTPREHVALYASVKCAKLGDDDISRMLKSVNLEQVADKPVGTLSGGMKRRLSLSLSTIGSASILFLDEPTTGLDPINKKHIQTLIHSLKQDRIIIMTTHDMHEADILADKLGVMSGGELVATGTAWELKNKAFRSHGEWRRFSLAVEGGQEVLSELRQAILSLSVDAHFPKRQSESCSLLSFLVAGPELSARLARVVTYLESIEDDILRSWGVSCPTLEDAYVEMVENLSDTQNVSCHPNR